MKKLLLALTLTVSGSAFAIITSPMSNQIDNTGTQIRKDKIFIRVKNSSGSTIATGSVVTFDVADDDGMGVTTIADDLQVPLCVVADTHTAAIADNAMFLCQTWGYHSGISYDGYDVATAGEIMYMSSRDAGLTRAAFTYEGTTSAATAYPVGVFYDSDSSRGSVEGFIRLQ